VGSFADARRLLVRVAVLVTTARPDFVTATRTAPVGDGADLSAVRNRARDELGALRTEIAAALGISAPLEPEKLPPVD